MRQVPRRPLVVISYEDSGHVAADDARDWDAADLLDNLKRGTEAQNEARRQMGVSELVVLGWVEPPRYDEVAHRLVWSAAPPGQGRPGGAARRHQLQHLRART